MTWGLIRWAGGGTAPIITGPLRRRPRRLSALRTTPVPTPHPCAPGQQALAGLIGAIGERDFAHGALQALNAAVQVASWSVYRLLPAGAPLLHLSASLGVQDTTQGCFAAYRQGLYRRDRSFDGVRQAARPGHALVLRMRADEAPNAEHRDIIYRRHGLAERLSVAALEADGSLLAVNLYHHEHQGAFSAAERERFADIAPLLLVAVRRQLALARADGDGAPAAQASPRQRLASACPKLTPRELDICERLLRGYSHDGVAADLGLTVATVKTYRARAFARLGLHFRSELFARFGTQPGCRPLG
jgi:DNA-binding CsgD family transcriptional regulator